MVTFFVYLLMKVRQRQQGTEMTTQCKGRFLCVLRYFLCRAITVPVPIAEKNGLHGNIFSRTWYF